jgi:hypothetical protein
VSPYEQEDLKAILSRIYPPALVARWDMNEQMAETLLEMSSELTNCSKLMALVPRPLPPGGRPLRYIASEARRQLLNQLRDDDTYLSCVKVGAASYRSKFEAASMGL